MSGTLRGCILHCVAPGEGERDCSQPGLQPGIAGLVGKPHSFTGTSCTHGVGQSNSWHHSSSSGLAGLSPDSRFNPDGISTRLRLAPRMGLAPRQAHPKPGLSPVSSRSWTGAWRAAGAAVPQGFWCPRGVGSCSLHLPMGQHRPVWAPHCKHGPLGKEHGYSFLPSSPCPMAQGWQV